VVSALGSRAQGPGFDSEVVPLFYWVASLGKLFTHIVSPVSQLQETGVQKGSFRLRHLILNLTDRQTDRDREVGLWLNISVGRQFNSEFDLVSCRLQLGVQCLCFLQVLLYFRHVSARLELFHLLGKVLQILDEPFLTQLFDQSINQPIKTHLCSVHNVPKKIPDIIHCKLKINH